MKIMRKVICLMLAGFLLSGLGMPVSVFAFQDSMQKTKAGSCESLMTFSAQYHALCQSDEPLFASFDLQPSEIKQVSSILESDSVDLLDALDQLDEQNDKTEIENVSSNGISKTPASTDKSSLKQASRLVEEAATAQGIEAEEKPNGALSLSKPFQTKRLIVKSSKVPQSTGAANIIGGYRNLYVLQYDSSQEAETAFETLQKRKDIEYVSEDSVCSVSSSHLSWGYESDYVNIDNYNPWVRSVVNPQPEVMVAVIDTGVDYNHVFLSGRVDTEHDYDFVNDDDDAMDDHYHGTHVAGTVVDGTTENVRILPIKVLSNKGSGSTANIVLAIYYATEHGADVMNLSLGGPGEDPAMEEAINDATQHGVIVCAAAGNDSEDASRHHPANIESAITVAAVTSANKLASFSNFGDIVDIAAPGQQIYSSFPCTKTYPSGRYSNLNGTSMATPHVAAACACLKSYNKSITSEQAMAYFTDTAKPVNSSKACGVGLLCMKDIVFPDASKLFISESFLSMYPGMEAEIQATSESSNDVIWSSSDSSVASVEGGHVIANAVGECMIIAQTDDQTRYCKISVTPLCLTISKEKVELYVDMSEYLRYDCNHRVEIRFESSDPSVEINNNGLMNAISGGTSTITVIAAEGTESECRRSVQVVCTGFGDWYDKDADSFVIKTPEELYELSIITNQYLNFFDDCTVEISDDVESLDLSGYPDWLPIYVFQGVFDGKNIPITGLTIQSETARAGLFQEINGHVKNVVLQDVCIFGKNKAGGLCALANSHALIENCTASGIVSGGENIGGLCGMLDGATVVNCRNHCSVTMADAYAGGICAVAKNGSRVINCFNDGAIEGEKCGGICGWTTTFANESLLQRDDIVYMLDRSRTQIYNCVNLGSCRYGISCLIDNAEVRACYSPSVPNSSFYKSVKYKNSDPLLYTEPKCLYFDASWNIINSLESLTDLLNGSVYRENAMQSDFSLFVWRQLDSTVVLTDSIETDDPVFWFEDDDGLQTVVGKAKQLELCSNIQTEEIVWSTEREEDMISIDENGVLTASSAGESAVICSVPAYDKSFVLAVYVSDPGEWYYESEEIYHISNTDDLFAFAQLVNDGFDTFSDKQIDLDEDLDLKLCKNWIPIGIGADAFAGTFNGNGHKISNMKVSDSDHCLGFFRRIGSGGTLENLELEQAYLTASGYMISGVACAILENGAVVRNCQTSGRLCVSKGSSSAGALGGVVGWFRNALVEDCVSYVSVIGGLNDTGININTIGGICACGYGKIKHCINFGSLSNAENIGGIFGYQRLELSDSKKNSELLNCISMGTIMKCKNAGGVSVDAHVMISNCLNHAAIGDGETQIQAAAGVALKDESNFYRLKQAMDNVVSDGSYISCLNSYSIGLIRTAMCSNVFWRDAGADDVFILKNNLTVPNEAYSFDDAYKIDGNEHLVDMLNTHVQAKNLYLTGSSSYLYWALDADRLLWFRCDHTHVAEKIIPATCMLEGSRQLVCDDCKKPIGEAQTIETLSHSFTDWILDPAPTCTQKGARYKQCLNCGMIEKDSTVIPKLGHEPAEAYTITKQPTCQSFGYMYKLCIRCNATISNTRVRIDKLPHTPSDDYSIAQEPSCSEVGYQYKTCIKCGTRIEESRAEIEKLPHTPSLTYTVVREPSCSAMGSQCLTCIVCGEVIDESAVPIAKLSHTPSETYRITREPTCEMPGEQAKYCLVCDESIDETSVSIPKLEHSGYIVTSSSSCQYAGYQYLQCTLCGKEVDRITLDKIDHDYVKKNVPATCLTRGYTLYTCWMCETSYQDDFTDFGPHDPQPIPDRAATCMQNGSTGGEKCSVCGKTLKEPTELKALGHTDSDENGNCKRCGEQIEVPKKPTPKGVCKYCGKTHTGPFGWLIKLFHSFLAVFK